MLNDFDENIIAVLSEKPGHISGNGTILSATNLRQVQRKPLQELSLQRKHNITETRKEFEIKLNNSCFDKIERVRLILALRITLSKEL